MALLETLSQIVEQYFSNLGYSPVAVAKEFSRELSKEINLIYEGQSTDRLRRYFENDPHIHFPKVYWSATTRNVLTLEEIHGRLLSTLSPDSLSPAERRAVVAKGTDAVFKQCLRFGFFHADPHPGNIFLQTDGSLCFIDCGMTGQLDRKTTDQLIDLVAGVIRGDIEKLCRVVIELTDTVPSKTDRRDFRADLQHLISHFQNADLQHLDISTLLSEFFGMLQSYQIQCPGDLLLLTKALTTIEGVAAYFDPTFDVLAHVEPQIQEIVTNRYGINALKDRFTKAMTGYFELLEDVPGDIQRFLDYARHSRFTLNLELKRIEHLADKIDLASRVMGVAMIIAALIVGSSILILADRFSDQQGFLGTMGLVGLGAGRNQRGGLCRLISAPQKTGVIRVSPNKKTTTAPQSGRLFLLFNKFLHRRTEAETAGQFIEPGPFHLGVDGNGSDRQHIHDLGGGRADAAAGQGRDIPGMMEFLEHEHLFLLGEPGLAQFIKDGLLLLLVHRAVGAGSGNHDLDHPAGKFFIAQLSGSRLSNCRGGRLAEGLAAQEAWQGCCPVSATPEAGVASPVRPARRARASRRTVYP